MDTHGILSRTRSLFQSLRIPTSGLSAQRARMDVIAQNIANAKTTSTAAGLPYRRQVAVLGEVMGGPPLFRLGELPWSDEIARDETRVLEGVEVVAVQEDPTDFVPVYDPGHPNADEDGYVQYPNVDMTSEMVDLLGTQRLYEANLSVFQAVKAMLRQAVQI